MFDFDGSKLIAAAFSLAISAAFLATAILPASPNGLLANGILANGILA